MSRVLSYVMRLFYFLMSLIIKVDDHSIVFGAWAGNTFSDNSRYLAEYIAINFPEYKLYWVGKKSIKEQVEHAAFKINFIEKDTIKCNLTVLKCRYCFVSQKYRVDISEYKLLRHTIICYLHHGTPVKKWGDDGLNSIKPTSRYTRIHYKLVGKTINYDYYASSSPLNSEVLCTAMRSCRCSMDKIIPSGTPRNDFLINSKKEIQAEYKSKILRNYGINDNQTVVLYLPTFRRLGLKSFSLFGLPDDQRARLEELLNKHNAVLIEKNHRCVADTDNDCTSKCLLKVVNTTNVQELLLFADILISDYSGAFLDFTLLDRPVIHFAYDYEEYRDVDSGLYYDIEDFHAGEVVDNFDALCLALEKQLCGRDEYVDIRHHVREKYMEYERGTASKTIFDTVVLSDKKKRNN